MVLVTCVRVVRVAVRFLAIPCEIVLVLVVYIMYMGVHMPHRMMNVFVCMLFCQMQPYAKCHECAGRQQRQRQCLAHE